EVAFHLQPPAPAATPAVAAPDEEAVDLRETAGPVLPAGPCPCRTRPPATGHAARSSAPRPTTRTCCPARTGWPAGPGPRIHAARAVSAPAHGCRGPAPMHSRPSAVAAGAPSG